MRVKRPGAGLAIHLFGTNFVTGYATDFLNADKNSAMPAVSIIGAMNESFAKAYQIHIVASRVVAATNWGLTPYQRVSVKLMFGNEEGTEEGT